MRSIGFHSIRFCDSELSHSFLFYCVILQMKFMRSGVSVNQSYAIFLIINVDPGVAYSKHIVHLYSYHGGDDLRNLHEVCLTFRFQLH